nr:protein SHQ1 homolog [Oncorhynchus nerka]
MYVYIYYHSSHGHRLTLFFYSCVLKCLLDIHKIFQENEPAYLLNDLYITDYCVLIQRVKSRKVTPLADPLQKVSLRKIDLELEVLETVVLVEEEEKGSSRTPQSHSREESDRTQERDCADRGGKRRRVCRGQPPPACLPPTLPGVLCCSRVSREEDQCPPFCCGQPQPADPGAGREGK